MSPATRLCLPICVLGLVASVRGQAEPGSRAGLEEERRVVPEASERAAAERTIRVAFAEAFEDTSPDGRRRLAEYLEREGRRTADPVARFVCWEHARRFAVQAGEPRLALALVDHLAGQYAIDRVRLAEQVVLELAGIVRTPGERLALARRALRIVAEAIGEERYASAGAIAGAAAEIAGELEDSSLLERACFARGEASGLEELHRSMLEAARWLAEGATSTGDNARVAAYWAVGRGDLRRALPYLARSDDARLAPLATLDIARPASGPEQLRLAESWRSASRETPITELGTRFPYRWHLLSRSMQKRSLYWYTSARPKLEGEARDQVDRLLSRTRSAPRTPRFGVAEGRAFEAVSRRDAVLVGVRYSLVKVGGGEVVASLKAIFRTSRGEELGAKHHGAKAHDARDIVARPGYAVAAFVARGRRRLAGFRVVFQRLIGPRLDAGDSYSSEWIGGQTAAEEVEIGGGGRVVTGFFGFAESEIHALGLVYAPSTP